MSFWSRPSTLLGIGGVLVAAAFIPTPGSKSSNPFETQGSKNIGARWSAGGGSDTHTPGAATPRGSAEANTSNQINPKGINSEHFKENVASQRPGEPGPFDKNWNKAHYGTEKGK